MEPEGSLPRLQEPATCPYSKPDQSCWCLPFSLLEDPFAYYPPIYLSTPMSSKWTLYILYPHQTLYAPLLSSIRATQPANLILLDFIARILFDEKYRSLSSSLRSLLHYPVTSPLLSPSIFLSTLICNTLGHHSVVRPQVADVGTVSNMEGSCEYTE
jgi:hypothetical protein